MPKVLEYLSKLFSQLKPNASVLELGCGPGVPFTRLLANHELELHITAVDISASQIALAREKVSESSRVEFVHADMTKLDFPEGKFDAIVAFYSWFHLPKEEQGLMVAKIATWLKPGGILLLNTSSEEGDVVMNDWMGVRMFSTGFGVEGTLGIFKEFGKDLDITDEVVGEKVGSQEVLFHWIWAVKK